jgi:glycosyltransferase involved in cell wall biosynthesis
VAVRKSHFEKKKEEMRVSILICTRDRAAALRETLSSLARVVVPVGWKVELLVVDNGSRDGTREVAQGARFGFGNARVESEPVVGVASARNRCLDLATGEVLLWTDDDVRLPRDWIEKMVEPIAQGRMDAVAGGVCLAFGRKREWMGRCLRTWLASSEGLSEGRPGRMIGANMAFHRRVLRSKVRFDPVLGPGALGMGEETLFSYQIEKSGFVIGSAFDVVVEHAFDCGRLCPAGLARLAYSMGRSEAYIAHHWHGVDARGSLWKRADALLRLAYWRCRARAQNKVPPGLLEGELQALARVHYWSFLSQIRLCKRKYGPEVGGQTKRVGKAVCTREP